MDKFLIKPIDSWIHLKEQIDISADKNTSAPFTFILIDYQEKITDSSISTYKRTIEKIRDASRIEDASLIVYELQEHNNQVVFHNLTIIRNNKRINMLDPEKIRVSQRELLLEKHITNNKITISMSIDDLRVGDIIDLQATEVIQASDHPVHGKYYHSTFWLNWSCPVQQQTIRITNQSSKDIAIRNCSIEEGVKKNELIKLSPNEEFTQSHRDLTQMLIDDAAPHWLWVNFIQATTDTSWLKISAYLYHYYDNQGALENQIDLTETPELTPSRNLEEDIINIIRFVQNEIRYKGENHGIFSHTPKKPQHTLDKRYGDCKDKSNLLIALLKQKGIEAHLVLVATDYGHKIHQLNPSPLHFNHMIVHIVFNGKDFFFDPTIKKQAGDLEHSATLNYGHTLILLQDGCNLQKIPHKIDDNVFHLKHIFDLKKGIKKGCTLKIMRNYYKHRADNMRYYFQSKDMNKVNEDFHRYAEDETQLELAVEKPITIIKDDLQNNIVNTEEIYRINKTTHQDDGQFHILTPIYQEFPLARSNEKLPLRIDLDGKISHDIEVIYSRKPKQQNTREQIFNTWFSYNDKVIRQGKSLHLSASISPLKSHVKGHDIDEYLQEVELVRNRSMNNFSYQSVSLFKTLMNYVYISLGIIYFLFLFFRIFE